MTIIFKASEGCPVDLTMWSHWQLGERAFVIQRRFFSKEVTVYVYAGENNPEGRN